MCVDNDYFQLNYKCFMHFKIFMEFYCETFMLMKTTLEKENDEFFDLATRFQSK